MDDDHLSPVAKVMSQTDLDDQWAAEARYEAARLRSRNAAIALVTYRLDLMVLFTALNLMEVPFAFSLGFCAMLIVAPRILRTLTKVAS